MDHNNLIINALLDNNKIANMTDVLEFISNPDNDMNKIATMDGLTIKLKAIECCICRKLYVACNYKISLDTRDGSKHYCQECNFYIPYRYRVEVDIERLFDMTSLMIKNNV